jgi:hypothetical protein
MVESVTNLIGHTLKILSNAAMQVLGALLLQGRTYNAHVGLRGLKRYGKKNRGLNLRIVWWREVSRPMSFTRSHIFPLRTWYATVSSAIGNSARDTSHNNRHVPLG